MISPLEEKKNQIKSALAELPNQEARYRYIIEKGRALPPLSDEQKLDKFLIQGCMSRAWLVPEFRDGKVFFHPDSDASIVKGIMAVLCELYSGNTPEENLSVSAEFLRDVGIVEHLSMNRRSGLAGVLKQIQLYSVAFSHLKKA